MNDDIEKVGKAIADVDAFPAKIDQETWWSLYADARNVVSCSPRDAAKVAIEAMKPSTIWTLEIPQEPTFVFSSVEALKTWVEESNDCPVQDYFGKPVRWQKGEVSDDWYGSYHESAHHTEYMYAYEKEVLG